MNEDLDIELSKYPVQLAERIEESGGQQKWDQEIGRGGRDQICSIRPVSVVEYYLAVSQDDWSEKTFRDNSYDLTRFLEYCDYANIEDLSNLSSRDIEGFKHWRKKDGNIVLATLHGQLANIRGFIRACERLEIVEDGLADSIELPDLEKSDIVSHVRIRPDEAHAILDHYETFDYASRRHAEFSLIWASLARLGGIRGLDLDNYHKNDDGEAYVEFTHDPEEDTPLKNGESEVEGEGGEREVNLPDWVAQILDDYIDENRIETTDDYGRRPLFTTSFGRVSEATLRRDIYRISQPCRYGRDCPHGREPNQCDARNDNKKLSQCPESVSPHPVRRGGICYQLTEGVPKDLICERADVSRKVLNKHYDIRTKEEARVQRRDELKEHLDGYRSTSDEREVSEKEETTTRSSLPASFESELPLAKDLLSAKDQIAHATGEVNPLPASRQKAAKGLAAYGAYVSLTGINFGLLGIGFDPTTMELILPF